MIAPVRAIAKVTFSEVVRDKVLYNIFLFAILLLGVGFLASRLTFIRPDRVILDFGLSAVSLSCSVIGIFTGATLLIREFERRTIYVALSRPISRAQFVFGKFAGLAGVLIVNWLLLGGAFLLILGHGGTTLFEALALVLIQSFALAAIAILFSAFTTTSLSVVFSLGVYLLGNNVSQVRFLAGKEHSPLAQYGLKAVASILPNLEYFNLGLRVTYALPVESSYLFFSVAYGACLTGVALVLAGVLVKRKE